MNISLLRPTVQRALTLFTLVLAAAAAEAQDVRIAPALKAGDEFRLEITRVRENSMNPAQNSRTVTPVDVRVISVAADGLVLNWVPDESEIESGSGAVDPLVGAAANAVSGLQLRIKLNPSGEYTGLANEAEVLSQVQRATGILVRGVTEKLPVEQRRNMERLVGQLLSPANLVAMVTRDVQTYFSLNGVSLVVGRPLEIDLEHPSPVGSGVIPAKFVVTMTSATADAAVLTTKTEFDGPALLRMTRALAEQGGQKVTDADLAGMTMKMSDGGNFVHDRTVGLMREVIVNRRNDVGPAYRLDRWEIRLVRAPQR